MMQPLCSHCAAFVRSATRVAKLLRIINVQCHGGIDNERNFSGMKFNHNDLSNSLKNKHLNATLRAWSEKDKLLADDRLLPQMWGIFKANGLPR
jgi:hypothetical protein